MKKTILTVIRWTLCAAALTILHCAENGFEYNNPLDPDGTNYRPYTLKTNVSPYNSGSVSVNPNNTSYAPDEQVTVTAAPNAGYTFKNWSGASSSTDAEITITMDGNKTLTAYFER